MKSKLPLFALICAIATMSLPSLRAQLVPSPSNPAHDKTDKEIQSFEDAHDKAFTTFQTEYKKQISVGKTASDLTEDQATKALQIATTAAGYDYIDGYQHIPKIGALVNKDFKSDFANVSVTLKKGELLEISIDGIYQALVKASSGDSTVLQKIRATHYEQIIDYADGAPVKITKEVGPETFFFKGLSAGDSDITFNVKEQSQDPKDPTKTITSTKGLLVSVTVTE